MPQRKIRVLQLVENLGVGGAERLVLMLAMNSDPKRFEVIPCAIQESGPLADELKAAGIPHRTLGMSRHSVLTGPLFIADLRRILAVLADTLRDLSIDIVHAHLTESTLLGIVAARQAGIPRVCTTVHNIIFSSERSRLSPREWLLRIAINQMFSRADRVIAVSDGVSKALRQNTKIPPERILTIPNGVEAHGFRSRGDRDDLRQKLEIPADKLLAVTVGRLTKQKGYPYLLEGLALIPPKKRPLALIIGDGPDRNDLESKTKAMGLKQNIRFLGIRRDVSALLATADIFVLPSLWEGLPLVLIEAMAAGLPAVVTAVGGNPEVVKDNISGILIPPRDAQALARAVCSLLNDPSKRHRFGRAARERFESRFSMQRFIEAHERLYEDLLMIPDRSACSVLAT
jgi:glycosyltransferase involved in cell wall biosynthesis